MNVILGYFILDTFFEEFFGCREYYSIILRPLYTYKCLTKVNLNTKYVTFSEKGHNMTSKGFCNKSLF